jgi:hypothetical protein
MTEMRAHSIIPVEHVVFVAGQACGLTGANYDKVVRHGIRGAEPRPPVTLALDGWQL